MIILRRHFSSRPTPTTPPPAHHPIIHGIQHLDRSGMEPGQTYERMSGWGNIGTGFSFHMVFGSVCLSNRLFLRWDERLGSGPALSASWPVVREKIQMFINLPVPVRCDVVGVATEPNARSKARGCSRYVSMRWPTSCSPWASRRYVDMTPFRLVLCYVQGTCMARYVGQLEHEARRIAPAPTSKPGATQHAISYSSKKGRQVLNFSSQPTHDIQHSSNHRKAIRVLIGAVTGNISRLGAGYRSIFRQPRKEESRMFWLHSSLSIRQVPKACYTKNR